MSKVTPRDREEKLLAAIADGTAEELPTPRNRKEKLLKEIYDNGGGGGGGTSVTVDSKLSTTSKNPVQNKVITQALNEKGTYSKPTGGIPKTDLASEVQASLENADNVSTLATEVDEINNNIVQQKDSGYLSKNLLNSKLQTTTLNGVTCTNNGDGTYTLNGTASSDTSFFLASVNNMLVDLNNTFYGCRLVGCPSGGNSLSGYSLYFTLRDSAGKWLADVIDVGKGAIINKITVYITPRILVRSGTVCDNVVFKPMITTDLNATYDDFVPYAPSNIELQSEVDEIDNGLNSLFRYYEGVDLTQKFASEIANYSDEWAWIKARIQAGNFKGIYVCDYIPITCSNGYVLNAQVAGINTYKGYGDQQIGNHIDFICKELWEEVHVMNKVNYNNGNANSPSPFLASDLNYWLNSMSGNVPNSESDPSVTTEVDYTTSGVLYYLPDKLKNQIITKRILLPSRYTEGKVLTNDNSWAWQSTGKLWIPSEVEVYGRLAGAISDMVWVDLCSTLSLLAI